MALICWRLGSAYKSEIANTFNSHLLVWFCLIDAMRTCQFKKAIKKLSRSTDVVWIDVCRILLFRHDNAEISISLLEKRASEQAERAEDEQAKRALRTYWQHIYLWGHVDENVKIAATVFRRAQPDVIAAHLTDMTPRLAYWALCASCDQLIELSVFQLRSRRFQDIKRVMRRHVLVLFLLTGELSRLCTCSCDVLTVVLWRQRDYPTFFMMKLNTRRKNECANKWCQVTSSRLVKLTMIR